MNNLKKSMYFFSIMMLFCAVMDLFVWFKGGYHVPSYILSILFVGLSVLGMIIIKEVDLRIE